MDCPLISKSSKSCRFLAIHDKHKSMVNGGCWIAEYASTSPGLGQVLSAIEWAIVDGELENDNKRLVIIWAAISDAKKGKYEWFYCWKTVNQVRRG